jgi:hypothetical protein
LPVGLAKKSEDVDKGAAIFVWDLWMLIGVKKCIEEVLDIRRKVGSLGEVEVAAT